MRFFLFSSIITVLLPCFASGQQAASARITGTIDEHQLVVLHGNRHPLARAEFDHGVAPDDLPMHRMLLLLSRAPEQQAALDKLVEEQHTAGSAQYRQWLRPADFASRFGPADADVQAVSQWLRQQGFSVTRVANGKAVIEFDGSAGQVRNAFHTTIHQYNVHGHDYWANAQDPQIPAALKPVVRGIVSLNNFPIRSRAHETGVFTRNPNGTVTPAFTVNNGISTYYALGPTDFATIYNTQPLVQAGNNGAGQTIAVIGVSNVNLQDITAFRNLFGLGAGNTSVVLDGPDPGIVAGAEDESVLDLEWTNAVAPGAAVTLVSAEDTETTSGLGLAALYAIENNLAGVISLSYSSCEAQLGNGGNQYFQSLWEQAAAQGITVVVSAGDDGSAGCDDQDIENVASSGLAVSGIASTPFNVAVGGTDFDDVGTQSTYWNSTNAATTFASAKSYIPETTWNQSCAATASGGNLNVCPALPASGTPPASLQLWSGSGGASSCSTSSSSGGNISCQSGTAKPGWQSGNGVPADGVRDIPDVSLFAAAGSASNSFYVVCQADALPSYDQSCQPNSSGTYFIASGGTSAAAPGFAGIVALAEQKTGSRLGNLNYLLYSLAAGPGASCSSNASGSNCVFHDVVLGNNSVPCKAGSPNCSLPSGSGTGVIVNTSQSPAYNASAGYDLATGLGSVNAANLVAAIANAANSFTPTSTTLMLNGSTTAVTAQHGSAISVGVNVSPSASTGEVSLFGNSGSIDFNPLAGGSASWSSKLFPGGSYSVKAHYPGDGTHGASDSNSVPVTINPESSQTFVNLVAFGATGIQSFTAGSVSYGSPYVLRMDVTDASGSISSTQGVTSKCSTGSASCPTGTMTLTANGSALDGGSFKLNSKGFAEDQPIQLPAGSYTLAASYPGDASYTASTGTSNVAVTKAATTLSTGNGIGGPFQYGSSFQIGASLSTASSGVTPTGAISFVDNGSPAANVFSLSQTGGPGGGSGYAYLSYSARYAPASLGTHTLSAQYSGDSNYSSSTSNSFSINVVKGNTTIESYGISPRTATPNFPVTLSVTIFTNSSLNAPTGTVIFSDNGNPLTGTVTYTGSNGSCCSIASLVAQMNVVFSQLGNHDITMSYSGDSDYNGVAQDLGTLVVDGKVPTTISVNPIQDLPANSSIYIDANIGTGNYGGPAMTGTVSFQDGNNPISGTVTYDPTPQYGSMFAAVSYAFPTPGVHTVTYQYSGDSNYAASSGSVAVNVLGPLGLSFPGNTGGATPNYGGSVTIGTAAVPLFVDNETSSAMTVALSCTPASNGAPCSPNPASLTVNSYTTPQVTINVTAPTKSASLRHRYPMTFPFVFAGILIGVGGMRSRKQTIFLVVITLAMLLPLASCGGGGGGSGIGSSGGSSGGGTGTTGVAAGTYSFTVTATSGANTASRNFTVTFQ